jgi:hypothetical protein
MRITEIIFEKEQRRIDQKCWDGYKIGKPKTKVKGGVRVNNCVPANEEITLHGNEFFETYGWLPCETQLNEAEYRGRKVTLNKPIRSSNGPKKFHVYVKNDKGNVVKVNFGDPDMKIKKSDPARRRNFRARHNCDNPGPKWRARYWSCKKW